MKRVLGWSGFSFKCHDATNQNKEREREKERHAKKHQTNQYIGIYRNEGTYA